MTIRDLSKNGKRVTWTHEGTYYQTNSKGEGMWEMLNTEPYQVRGTCDFYLRGTIGAIRSKLNRMFDERDLK